MKFTIDLDKKIISIHGAFRVEDINKIFSLLNIEDNDTWLIDKYEETSDTPNIPSYPYIPNQPIYPSSPFPMQPYYYETICGTSQVELTRNYSGAVSYEMD